MKYLILPLRLFFSTDTDISSYLYLGITHAAVWAACCSFIAHNTDAELRPSAQSFIQGLHHGFGKFCGAVFGGMAIQNLGTALITMGAGSIVDEYVKYEKLFQRNCPAKI